VIVPFVDYVPAPRFDNTSWNRIKIYEAPAKTGPWTLIDTINIAADVDPAHPQARSFQTSNATLADGWYRVDFWDALNNVLQTNPIQRPQDFNWRPTLGDVGHIALARTRDANGVVTKTFSGTTMPTDDDVQTLIDKAVNDLRPTIGSEIPDDTVQDVQNLAALRAAMYIELTYFANEVAQRRSPYPMYKELYDEQVKSVAASIAAEETGEDTTDAISGNLAQYSFPTATNWMEGKM